MVIAVLLLLLLLGTIPDIRTGSAAGISMHTIGYQILNDPLAMFNGLKYYFDTIYLYIYAG